MEILNILVTLCSEGPDRVTEVTDVNILCAQVMRTVNYINCAADEPCIV